jgi:hypothetical protein
VKLLAKRKVKNNFFSSSTVGAVVGSWIRDPEIWDPGSRDLGSGIPRSGIRDKGWLKIMVRDKHSRSATPFSGSKIKFCIKCPKNFSQKAGIRSILTT